MRYMLLLLTTFSSIIVIGQKNLIRIVSSTNENVLLQPFDPLTHLFKIDSNEYKYTNFRHNYLIHNKELFLQLDGTGRLYKYNIYNNKLIRIDSTYFEGYNFGAYTFICDNQFYSFGGWGFWQFNGGLRYFDDKLKEWEVIPLDKEVTFSLKINAIVWHDDISKKIFLLYNPQKSSYYKNFNTISKDTVLLQCFDLNKKKWWDEPRLTRLNSNKLFDKSDGLQINTKNGFLFRDDGFITLIDFRNNRLLRLNQNYYNQLNTYALKFKAGYYFNIDSSIYFYNQIIDSVSTIEIKNNDFINTGESLYFDLIKDKNKITYLINNLWSNILINVFLIIITLIVSSKYFIKKNKLAENDIINKKSTKKLQINTSQSFSKNLTEQEKIVFQIILQNSLKNEMTSIDELNTKLGVKNKEVTVQNQLRSEVIQMINKKFNVFSSSTDLLVEREKTAFDKRVYEYKINNRYKKIID
jgi:hypothetical protein